MWFYTVLLCWANRERSQEGKTPASSLLLPLICCSLPTVVICLKEYSCWFWTRASWLYLLYKHQTKKSQPQRLYNIKGIRKQQLVQTAEWMQQSKKVMSSDNLITVKYFVDTMRKDAKRPTSSINFKDALLMLDEHQSIAKEWKESLKV